MFPRTTTQQDDAYRDIMDTADKIASWGVPSERASVIASRGVHTAGVRTYMHQQAGGCLVSAPRLLRVVQVHTARVRSMHLSTTPRGHQRRDDDKRRTEHTPVTSSTATPPREDLQFLIDECAIIAVPTPRMPTPSPAPTTPPTIPTPTPTSSPTPPSITPRHQRHWC